MVFETWKPVARDAIDLSAGPSGVVRSTAARIVRELSRRRGQGSEDKLCTDANQAKQRLPANMRRGDLESLYLNERRCLKKGAGRKCARILRAGLILSTSCTGHVGLGNRHAPVESGASKTGLNLAHNTLHSTEYTVLQVLELLITRSLKFYYMLMKINEL